MEQFKVGEKVKTSRGTGTIIAETNKFGRYYLVEGVSGAFCHMGGGVRIVSGRTGTKLNCWWFKASEMERVSEAVEFDGRTITITTDNKQITATYQHDGKKDSISVDASNYASYERGACAALMKVTGVAQQEVKQDKQPEPIKLYCVKDNNGICTKGNVYTIKSGSIQWDEFYEGNNYISFDDYKKRSPITASCLVPLVSRPAKVGEWVYITHTDFETIKVGDIAKVTAAPHSAGCIGVVSKSGNGSSHGHWHYNESEYLVLDGYQPFTR